METNNALWENLYSEGVALNLYPWDNIVSSVFTYRPRNKPKRNTSVLEIGCGAGCNIWFLAREGFSSSGFDISPSAIEFAKQRLENDCLSASLQVSDAESYSFGKANYDIVIDRAALTCLSKHKIAQITDKVHKSLCENGIFLMNGYSDKHTSARSGVKDEAGQTLEISDGSLKNVGKISFYNEAELLALFSDKWKLISLKEIVKSNSVTGKTEAEWEVIAQKV